METINRNYRERNVAGVLSLSISGMEVKKIEKINYLFNFRNDILKGHIMETQKEKRI